MFPGAPTVEEAAKLRAEADERARAIEAARAAVIEAAKAETVAEEVRESARERCIRDTGRTLARGLDRARLRRRATVRALCELEGK